MFKFNFNAVWLNPNHWKCLKQWTCFQKRGSRCSNRVVTVTITVYLYSAQHFVFTTLDLFFIISTSSPSILSFYFTERHRTHGNYDGYLEEFFNDSPSFGYLNFEDNNPQPQTYHHDGTLPSQPHLPGHRHQYKHGQDRNGKCLLVDNLLTRETRSIYSQQCTGDISLAFQIAFVMSSLILNQDWCFCADRFAPEPICLLFCRFCLQSSSSL